MFHPTKDLKTFIKKARLYTHHQNSASNTWTINHNTESFPSVSLKFSSSDEIYENVGAFAGNALSPQLLDLAGGSFPNLFLAGAVFQGLVLFVLLQFDKDELMAVGSETAFTETSEEA